MKSIGVKMITAHAREVVLPFYLKQGWSTVGERYTEVGIPHMSIEKRLIADTTQKSVGDELCFQSS